jgi:hypothetical protein
MSYSSKMVPSRGRESQRVVAVKNELPCLTSVVFQSPVCFQVYLALGCACQRPVLWPGCAACSLISGRLWQIPCVCRNSGVFVQGGVIYKPTALHLPNSLSSRACVCVADESTNTNVGDTNRESRPSYYISASCPSVVRRHSLLPQLTSAIACRRGFLPRLHVSCGSCFSAHRLYPGLPTVSFTGLLWRSRLPTRVERGRHRR